MPDEILWMQTLPLDEEHLAALESQLVLDWEITEYESPLEARWVTLGPRLIAEIRRLRAAADDAARERAALVEQLRTGIAFDEHNQRVARGQGAYPLERYFKGRVDARRVLLESIDAAGVRDDADAGEGDAGRE